MCSFTYCIFWGTTQLPSLVPCNLFLVMVFGMTLFFLMTSVVQSTCLAYLSSLCLVSYLTLGSVPTVCKLLEECGSSRLLGNIKHITGVMYFSWVKYSYDLVNIGIIWILLITDNRPYIPVVESITWALENLFVLFPLALLAVKRSRSLWGYWYCPIVIPLWRNIQEKKPEQYASGHVESWWQIKQGAEIVHRERT